MPPSNTQTAPRGVLADGSVSAIAAGLALIGAIASNVMSAIEDGEHREVSIITFLATASGLTLFGLGSAFWGIVIGSAAALVLKPARR